VGLLLAAGPASARIVYTPAYTTGGTSHQFALDLNHDGIADFYVYFKYTSGRTTEVDGFAAQAGNAILGKIQGVLSRYGGPYTCRVDSALPAGHRIGPGSNFGAYRIMADRRFFGISSPFFSLNCGYWQKGESRFLGLEFTTQGQKHFGWARLSLTGGVLGWAH
jgi:hypothetical protein